MHDAHSPQATRILDCAQKLIATGGYHGFSYADISVEVGITKASVHHHFAKKSDLVRVLVERYRNAAAEGLAALSTSVADPVARLRAYVAWWSACIGDGSMPICVCAMLGAEMPVLPPNVAEEVRLHFIHLAGWLEAALSAGGAIGSIRLKSAPAAEAHVFMATVHGAMLSARACAYPALFERIAATALQGLTAKDR
jgi:TetR/AcrR family transcriptional regulator, transcriptional repressor for nem operon